MLVETALLRLRGEAHPGFVVCRRDEGLFDAALMQVPIEEALRREVLTDAARASNRD